jgi:predicted MFS family arabinose efflux permease
VIATVMSGLLLGILLSRVLSGMVARVGGWRSVLLVAAGIQLVMSVSVYVLAPATGGAAIGERYPQVLASIIALIRVHPMLRHRMVLGFLGMACSPSSPSACSASPEWPVHWARLWWGAWPIAATCAR